MDEKNELTKLEIRLLYSSLELMKMDNQVNRLVDRIRALRAEVERQKERGKDILLLAQVFRSNHRGARAEIERLRAELAEAPGVKE